MMRFATHIAWLSLLGCDPPTREMNPLPNQLQIVLSTGTEAFDVSNATYNLKKEAHGYELTFSCETKESPEVDYPPSLEVTIFSEEKPPLVSQSEWKNQPAYVESADLGHLTNFYQWTHEGFEDFSVRILDISGDSLRCQIVGTVSLNPSEDKPVNVVVEATFLLDPNLGRGVQ